MNDGVLTQQKLCFSILTIKLKPELVWTFRFLGEEDLGNMEFGRKISKVWSIIVQLGN